jgi:ATP phosphoribosyltransferase
MLTLAIQKSGRLSDHTLRLLNEAGIELENGGTAKLKSMAKNFPLQILFLRDDDIPECIADEIADAGIVGENVHLEKNRELVIAERLGYAKCRLSIALPKESEFRSLEDLKNLKIATSYPRILKQFLDKNNLSSIIHEINGSVEIAPGIGLADAIFDIVGTGSTLLSNGLKEVYTVMQSEAVLVHRPNLGNEKQLILDQLLFRIRSVNRARTYKYILLNIPNENIDTICSLLPGMKSPTIIPLVQSGWSSLHSVIRENDFWERIENLKQAGAEGILVIPIEKMIL